MVSDTQDSDMQFKNRPEVAVFMVTYNHARYIEQAIAGVLMQQTDFPFKLFIGEDCSTDGTREICLKYQEKYPDKIELLLTEKNIGATLNAHNVYRACFAHSDYTAMCEGDDYWTDPLKLQQQVDFLAANPDFAICFHRVKIINEDGDKKSYLSNPNQKEVTTFEDLAGGNYIHTPSCVFRNHLFKEFPAQYFEMPIGDYPLHLLNAQYGKIKFLGDVMGVYRITSTGLWENRAESYRIAHTIPVIEQCREIFFPRGWHQFSEYLCVLLAKGCYLALENKNYEEFLNYYLKYLKFIRYSTAKQISYLSSQYLLTFTGSQK